jgi:hypothetical protein
MVRRRLRTGDYALEGYEGVCLIERKFDMREISKNLMTKDRKRFLGTLDRLRDECTHPILMLEGSPITVQRETTYTDHPFVVVDSLQRECRIRGIELMLIPGYTPVMRRAAGEWVVRTLINAALVHDIRGKSNGNDADCNDHQHQVD